MKTPWSLRGEENREGDTSLPIVLNEFLKIKGCMMLCADDACMLKIDDIRFPESFNLI